MVIAAPAPVRVWHARPVLLAAAATVLLHLAVAAGYGWHRDEMYFYAESRRMDWGFVSEPPFTPALAWLSDQLFGATLVGLRVWPALAGAAVAVLASLVARELGGGGSAQLVAAITTSTATVALSLFHLFGPSAFDQVAWAGCLLVLVKLLGGADPRWWYAFGAIAGIGLLNKNTLALLAIGVLGVLPFAPRLRSKHLWAAALLALVIASPYLVWQTAHGWPMVGVAGSISEETGGISAALAFLPMQVLTMNPLLAPIWIAGLWWLWRSRAYRPLAMIWVVLLVLLALVGGRSYYLLPAYLPLFAAGGIVLERWRDRPIAIAAALTAAAAVIVPSALPVLPIEAHRHLPFAAINPVLSDPIGWPDHLVQIMAVRPAGAPVLAGNYGEAAAVELSGIPAYSGHNAYGTWGPPPAGTEEVLAVGMPDPVLARTFTRCEQVAVLDNPYGVADEEHGKRVHVCRGPRASWAELWPGIVHVTN
ncbi:Dolichyl-phosphate-mannose-protein mannosyltransferase [Pseudonocardia thermophila]|uniref:Dolichyl-phosphate-mannose-protein mannosyltransferase n=1 Tax=Pseudonocardia thermophila TaxID=1848 RepID=A0A1M6RUV7_PSETH|nr:glycosyltransferase family 39 protein [Pseudonocardia thermophila]SHK36215.1 Dolichyl-phosphate-mannose-protein mannosyltransferase [Pseudonocardia thermophila]